MDIKQIMSLFKKNSKKRKLNQKELNKLCTLIVIPYDGIKEVKDIINAQLHDIIYIQTEDLMLYESFIPLYINNIYNSWIIALVDPGTPIGPITSDAIGQQATQALLNTFHQAGSAKSGGPDGIRENISISANRKVLYTVINFKNKNLKIEDVMNMRNEFISITLGDISETILPILIDIPFHRNMPEQYLPRTETAGLDMLNNKVYWWYPFCNFIQVYAEHPRHAIRIKLDIMKLYEFGLNTTTVAEKISLKTWKFKISKDDTREFKTIAIASPTYLGIIDVYISSEGKPNIDDMQRDYILQSCFGFGDFNTLEISGIQGIKIFYPVSIPVTSIIRDVKKSKDNKGTWVYFEDMRYSCVPISKLIDLCNAADLEIDNENISNIEYISHKIVPENRKIIEVKTVSFNGVNYLPLTELANTSGTGEFFMRETNNFFRIINATESSFKLPSIHIRKEPSLVNLDHCVIFESFEQVKTVIAEINNGNAETCQKLINPSFFHVNGIYQNIISFSIEVGEKHLKYFIWACNFYNQIFTVDVNVDYINSRTNLTTLNNALISRFGLREYSLPDSLRLPKIETLIYNKEYKKLQKINKLNEALKLKTRNEIETFINNEIDERIEDPLKRIFIKSTAFFRDEFDPIDKNTGKRKELKPVDRLKNFLNDNVDDKVLKEYAYAETQGSALVDLLSNPVIDSRTTYCNDFYHTFNIFGIEGLRNLLGYDLISIINSSGDVNVKYPILVSDVTTSNGINSMTSQGISSQNNGVLSTITFDNVKKYITKAALVGKFENAKAISTAIFLGNKVELGTGFVKIKFLEMSLTLTSPIRKKLNVGMKEFLENEEFEETKLEPKVIVGKFPKVKWVFESFVKKDIIFYLNMGIVEFFTQTLKDVKPLGLSFIKSKLTQNLGKIKEPRDR